MNSYLNRSEQAKVKRHQYYKNGIQHQRMLQICSMIDNFECACRECSIKPPPVKYNNGRFYVLARNYTTKEFRQKTIQLEAQAHEIEMSGEC